MKIVFDAQSIVEKRTGVGRYTLNLILELARLNCDINIKPFYFNFKRCFKEQSIFRAFKDINPSEINLFPGFIFHKIWKNFDVFPIDLFTGHADIFHYPNFLIKPYASGKSIITVHDLAFKRYPNTINPKNLKDLEKNFEKSLRKSDAVITVSEFSKNEFHYFFPHYKKNVYVAKNGADDFISTSCTDCDLLNVKLKYKLPEKYIIHVGTIEPRKNLTFLLKVMNEIKKIDPELKLILVGGHGWLSADFFETFHKLNLSDSVKIIGFIDGYDLPYLYKLSKLFVFPSLYEGFGLPPIEAMSQKVPVLASNIQVFKEILNNACEYFDLDASPKEWALKILNIVNDKELSSCLIVKGLELASTYTWKKTAKAVFSVYKDVLS